MSDLPKEESKRVGKQNTEQGQGTKRVSSPDGLGRNHWTIGPSERKGHKEYRRKQQNVRKIQTKEKR